MIKMQDMAKAVNKWSDSFLIWFVDKAKPHVSDPDDHMYESAVMMHYKWKYLAKCELARRMQHHG
jgi:hypothetical protein